MKKARSNEKHIKKRKVIIVVIIVLILVIAGSIMSVFTYIKYSKKETEGISALSAWAIGKTELQKLWGDCVGLERVKTDKINDNGTAKWWRFSCESTIDETQLAYVFVYYDGSVRIQTDDFPEGDFFFTAQCLKNWSIDSIYAYPKALKDPVVKAYLSRHFTNNLNDIYLGPALNETGEFEGCVWYFGWNTNRVFDRKCVSIVIDGETGDTLGSEEAR